MRRDGLPAAFLLVSLTGKSTASPLFCSPSLSLPLRYVEEARCIGDVGIH